MNVFLVRRSLADVPDTALRAAIQRCQDHAEELARSGHRIRYLGCGYVAADGFCGCVYEAGSADTVRLATERAAVPYDEIVPVVLPGSADWPGGSHNRGNCMSTHRLATRLAVGAGAAVGALALILGGAASSMAASPNGQTVTETGHQHGTWTEYGDTDFCTGADINPTITGNSVEHVTYFTGSDEVKGTFTEEGTVVGVIGDLTYTGPITVWGNINLNERNANNTFTAAVKLSATDDQGVVHTEVGHEVAHMSWNAVSDEPVVSFDKMTFTCS
jgi:Protein of unknown function (DUF4242)